jgi:hypothetical protein
VLTLALGLPAFLASCSSGSGTSGSGSASASSDAKLKSAGATVEQQMTTYQQAAQNCKSEANPVVCVEAADRTLGGQVHTYANLLATGKGFSAPKHLLAVARNNAQTLANSLEILGDAQPTQANYDQVLNTFDVNGALDQLRSAVTSLDHTLGT